MNWYVIIPMIASFIVTFLIGVYASKRVKETSSNRFLQEYFLGGRELGGLLLAMTMIATYGSASSFIGGPGSSHIRYVAWLHYAFGDNHHFNRHGSCGRRFLQHYARACIYQS